MPAGLNCRVRVWRRTAGADDSVGGAMITGTVAYQDVIARYTARRPSLLLLAQGLEVPRIGYFRMVPGTLDIRENDAIEITEPASHVYFGVLQQVIGVTVSSLNPKAGISELIVDVKHVGSSR